MINRRKEAAQGFLYILPSLVLILVFSVVPILMSLYFSFTKYNVLQPPQWTGLDNYIRLFRDPYVRASLKNTVVFTVITVPLQTAGSLVLAAVIAELFHNKFGNFVKSSLFVPVIASAILVGTLWFTLLSPRGVVNSIIHAFGLPSVNWLGGKLTSMLSVCIVSVWKNVGYFLVIYFAGIMDIPRSLYEAAEVDGANAFQRFFKITLPGLSSVQLLAAAVGRSWQEWKLVSAHGCACDPVAECLTAGGKPVFFLTGGAETPASLCGRLAAAGLGDAHVLVGEELGRAEEKILFGMAQEFAQKQFASLSVLLVEHLPQPPRRVPGFPDEAFHRGEVPMTKQEVRAAALAKLAVQPGDTLWDVGAGTGSVSVELALAAPRGHVYAVECDPEACGLIRQNRETFHACNLTLVEGRAPAALADLPAPDAVFIGGTKGGMEAVVDTVLARNPNTRICISAIALETLSAAVAALTAHGLAAEVTQIAVSRTRPAGRLHLLMANNPIFLITGERK